MTGLRGAHIVLGVDRFGRAKLRLPGRAKLRRMLKQEPPASRFFANGLMDMHATPGTRLLQGAEATPDDRKRPDTRDSDANRDESSGLQADTVALLMTALLGLGSFLLQAKVSKDADRSQKEIEMA